MRLSRKSAPTTAIPRCLVLRMVPCCLPQPKMHSVIARRDCDMPYPGCRVVRSSMALLRVLPVLVTALFCVTCGVALMARRLRSLARHRQGIFGDDDRSLLEEPEA